MDVAPKKKLLLADDSSIQRSQLRKILEKSGFTIVEAADGKEGVELAKGNPDVRLIIADLNMPVMDGLAMVANIRGLQGFDNVPVLMVTTESSADLRAQGRKLGVVAWIIKPFNPETLGSVVERALKGVSLSRSEFKV